MQIDFLTFLTIPHCPKLREDNTMSGLFGNLAALSDLNAGRKRPKCAKNTHPRKLECDVE